MNYMSLINALSTCDQSIRLGRVTINSIIWYDQFHNMVQGNQQPGYYVVNQYSRTILKLQPLRYT